MSLQYKYSNFFVMESLGYAAKMLISKFEEFEFESKIGSHRTSTFATCWGSKRAEVIMEVGKPHLATPLLLEHPAVYTKERTPRYPVLTPWKTHTLPLFFINMTSLVIDLSWEIIFSESEWITTHCKYKLSQMLHSDFLGLFGSVGQYFRSSVVRS